jgi:hypothetical protein
LNKLAVHRKVQRFSVRARLQDTAVLPILRKVLADEPYPETRRRVERLLAALAEPALSPKRLAALRGLEVLERSGTAEARALLKQLAEGLPDAQLTRDAKASLKRMTRSSSVP